MSNTESGGATEHSNNITSSHPHFAVVSKRHHSTVLLFLLSSEELRYYPDILDVIAEEHTRSPSFELVRENYHCDLSESGLIPDSPCPAGISATIFFVSR